MEKLLEKMAVILQWILDDGEASYYRPNIQEVLVAYNAAQQSVQRTFAMCAPEYHTELDEQGDRFCRMCGQPLSR